MGTPAIRTQVDGLDGEYSKETALDCSDMPDLARQEFKDESDPNKILARYGVDALIRPPQYADVDFDLDLQQSLEAIRTAGDAIDRLPLAIRNKYRTYDSLLEASANGNFKADLEAYYESQKAAAKTEAATPVVDNTAPVV